MYVIDEIERLEAEFPDITCFLLLFSKSPAREEGFISFNKKFICEKNQMDLIIDDINTFIIHYLKNKS